jgi:hypothetical protein
MFPMLTARVAETSISMPEGERRAAARRWVTPHLT